MTPLAEPLADGDGSVRPFALWSGGVSYQAFGALEHSVRTGEPAFEHLFGQEFFAYLADHPAVGDVFDAMMARHTRPVARSIAGIDLGGVETIVDLGGGRGDLLAGGPDAHPALRGVLVEYPRLVDELATPSPAPASQIGAPSSRRTSSTPSRQVMRTYSRACSMGSTMRPPSRF